MRKPNEKNKKYRITENTISMLVRVEPELRDGLNEIAYMGGMSRDQLLRATFRGMIDAWREAKKTVQENPSLFVDLNVRTDAAITRAMDVGINPPTSRMRDTGHQAMKGSAIKPRAKKGSRT